jgi:ParB family chromosome partitioning protein
MTTTTPTTPPKRALGRGLDSLLPSGPRSVAPPPAEAAAPRGDEIREIPLDAIDSNPHQTRLLFAPEALQQLADSIRETGLAQPIVVRPATSDPQRFVLILGERRCRASKLAGKTTIPAIIRQVSEQQAAEMTVVENLQRQDLTCIEQAAAFFRLSRDFGLTQEQIAQRVGVSRESVANYLRLLRLPEGVIHYLQIGKLTFAEGRALLSLHEPKDAESLAEKCANGSISFAQLVAAIKAANAKAMGETAPAAAAPALDPNVRAAQTEIERVLGLRVQIKDRHGRGRIVIEYDSIDDFDRLTQALSRK